MQGNKDGSWGMTPGVACWPPYHVQTATHAPVHMNIQAHSDTVIRVSVSMVFSKRKEECKTNTVLAGEYERNPEEGRKGKKGKQNS